MCLCEEISSGQKTGSSDVTWRGEFARAGIGSVTTLVKNTGNLFDRRLEDRKLALLGVQ